MSEVVLEDEEDYRAAFSVLAKEVVRLGEVVVAQGELLKAMDLKIRLLVTKPGRSHDVN
jgi:hypothetical protein